MISKALQILIVVFCLAGITVATMAYGEHYNTKPAPCDINSVWDCGIVNHSPFAVLYGVPVALIGAIGYGLLIALAGRFPWLAFLAAAAGFLFSLRFTWVEWRILQIWCLYCVTSQIIITILLGLTLAAAMRSAPAHQYK